MTPNQHFTELISVPALGSATAVAVSTVSLFAFYKRYLRRIPSAAYFTPSSFRRGQIYGRVTSVGDGDNFRLFHTPGGIWAGWGLFRAIPATRKELKDKTIHIRLAGIDAPELPHFGRPGQPFGEEAKEWLTNYVKDRNAKVTIYKTDQYSRIVGTAYVRKGLFWKDVGLEMCRSGFSTVYEARTGAEFGGKEELYRTTVETAKSKGLGMWARRSAIKRTLGISQKLTTETPGEFKQRMKIQNG